MRWFLYCLIHYADFNGRASRREYWENYVVGLVIGALLLILGIPMHFFLYVWALFQIATFMPTLAVTARRLHDTGLSGYWSSMYAISFFALLFGSFIGMRALSHVMTMADGDVENLINGNAMSMFNGIENIITIGEILSTAIVVMACRKGSLKPNRYGHVPSSVAPL